MPEQEFLAKVGSFDQGSASVTVQEGLLAGSSPGNVITQQVIRQGLDSRSLTTITSTSLRSCRCSSTSSGGNCGPRQLATEKEKLAQVEQGATTAVLSASSRIAQRVAKLRPTPETIEGIIAFR
jgi:hypothetical protein